MKPLAVLGLGVVGPAGAGARVALEPLARFLPERRLRRVDRFSRMALLAAWLALEDAGGERFAAVDRERIGLAFGTGHGAQEPTYAFKDAIRRDGDRLAPPTAFAGSVTNAMAAQVTMALDIRGPCQTLATFERTVVEVLATAALWLEGGAADLVLAQMGDESSDVLHYAAAKLGGDRSATSLPCGPGEGCVAFLLAREEAGAGRRGLLVLDGEPAAGRPWGSGVACGSTPAGAAAEPLDSSAPGPDICRSLPVAFAFELAAALESRANLPIDCWSRDRQGTVATVRVER